MPNETETPPPALDDVAQAQMRDALQEVADIFAPAQGGGVLSGLDQIGRLADPDVRQRLNEAMQTLQSAQGRGGHVHMSSMAIDLRGTEAGEAIRRALGLAGSGAQIFASPDPQVTAPEPVVIEGEALVHESSTIEAPPPAPETVWSSPARFAPQAPVPQPSLVEDAGGGLIGWLGRLFGRR